MYPSEREIKDMTESNTSTSYFKLFLTIGRYGQLCTSLYDKRDDFKFHITNVPFLSSRISSSPAYDVYVSQLIGYARVCSSYLSFIMRSMRLSKKPLGQGYVLKNRSKEVLWSLRGSYKIMRSPSPNVTRHYGCIMDADHIHWHPPLIRHYTNFWPLLIWTLLPKLTFT